VRCRQAENLVPVLCDKVNQISEVRQRLIFVDYLGVVFYEHVARDQRRLEAGHSPWQRKGFKKLERNVPMFDGNLPQRRNLDANPAREAMHDSYSQPEGQEKP
jgi:hypothetical protein